MVMKEKIVTKMKKRGARMGIVLVIAAVVATV